VNLTQTKHFDVWVAGSLYQRNKQIMIGLPTQKWWRCEIKLKETHKRLWAWMMATETLVLDDVFSSPVSSLNKTKCLCLLSAKHNVFFFCLQKVFARARVKTF